MSLRLDRRTDRYVGHDYPGVRGHAFVQFELDEAELGGRAASEIGDPDQWYWVLHEEQIRKDLS